MQPRRFLPVHLIGAHADRAVEAEQVLIAQAPSGRGAVRDGTEERAVDARRRTADLAAELSEPLREFGEDDLGRRGRRCGAPPGEFLGEQAQCGAPAGLQFDPECRQAVGDHRVVEERSVLTARSRDSGEGMDLVEQALAPAEVEAAVALLIHRVRELVPPVAGRTEQRRGR